jgi:ABC-type transporter Mla maintaining outer membrane lipid asymmetry permease subunit MlaE
MASPFRAVGSATRNFLGGYGGLAALFGRSLAGTRRLPRYAAEALGHYRTIAIGSISLIFVTSIFMGFVLGVQIGAQTAPSTPVWFEGGVIIRAALLEVGPIVTGLVLSAVELGYHLAP